MAQQEVFSDLTLTHLILKITTLDQDNNKLLKEKDEFLKELESLHKVILKLKN